MANKENNMASPTDDAQRKIYVLPKELVERIVNFQKSRRYPSEVEAVRHLLNKGLVFCQTPDELMLEVFSCLINNKSTESIVNGLLVGHPLVASLTIQKNGYFFTLENGDEYKINKNKAVLMKKKPNGDWVAWFPF